MIFVFDNLMGHRDGQRKMLIERFVFVLHVLRRRWYLLLLPPLLIAPIAAYNAYATPIKYVAKSVILLQSANRGTASGGSTAFPRQSVIEQVSVIEAWLKSDHILGGLLPQLLDDPIPADPDKLLLEMTKLRRGLTFEVVGNAVLELSFAGSSSKGLGRKLEIIVTRLLEGMLSPDDGILSAERMVALRKSEALNEIEQALNFAIDSAGLGPTNIVKGKLAQIYLLQKESLSRPVGTFDGRSASVSGTATDRPGGARPLDKARLEQQLTADRAALTLDARLLERLERQYVAYEEARATAEAAKQSANSRSDTYVRVFDSPANLTVVGRPRDPLYGESNRRKLFLAQVFISLILGMGLIVLAEIFDRRLLGRQEFESVAGVPVITRLSQLNPGDFDRESDGMVPPAAGRPTSLGRSFRFLNGSLGAKEASGSRSSKASHSPKA